MKVGEVRSGGSGWGGAKASQAKREHFQTKPSQTTPFLKPGRAKPSPTRPPGQGKSNKVNSSLAQREAKPNEGKANQVKHFLPKQVFWCPPPLINGSLCFDVCVLVDVPIHILPTGFEYWSSGIPMRNIFLLTSIVAEFASHVSVLGGGTGARSNNNFQTTATQAHS
jgi:hypothetical protein